MCVVNTVFRLLGHQSKKDDREDTTFWLEESISFFMKQQVSKIQFAPAKVLGQLGAT